MILYIKTMKKIIKFMYRIKMMMTLKWRGNLKVLMITSLTFRDLETGQSLLQGHNLTELTMRVQCILKEQTLEE
jgi:hypothetical protein